MTALDDPGAPLRRAVYALLIVVAAGAMTGRVVCVSSPSGKTPFLSANDRSRWSTIRVLVDYGTFALDPVVLDDRGRFDREWQTIDMVRHRGRDGNEHYYSSKPPLLPVLLAGQYWLIRGIAGATLEEEPLFIGRLMLFLSNVLPTVAMLLVLARIVERYGRTDAGRMFTMATAALGTFLTTFAVTLNNHLPAAISVVFASDAALRIVYEGDRRWRWFIVAGLFAAFAATNELPALAFTSAVGAALLWIEPRRTLAAFAPAAAVVAAAFFATNWIAHESWRPPYAHRSDGPVAEKLPAILADALDAGQVPGELRSASEADGVELSAQTVVEVSQPGRRWVIWDPDGADRWAVAREAERIEVRFWDNWYDYENSYWTSGRAAGVDRGEPSIAVYAFHVIVGHHGIFSLTPVWLLAVVGAVMLVRQRPRDLRGFAAMAAAITIVVLAFYIFRPLADRNYGGVTNGLRWSFWLIPLWLILMLPAADAACSRRRWFAAALLLLLVSVISVNYKPLNPWSHPWLFDYWTYLGWIDY
jgi:hypothetical protein